MVIELMRIDLVPGYQVVCEHAYQYSTLARGLVFLSCPIYVIHGILSWSVSESISVGLSSEAITLKYEEWLV